MKASPLYSLSPVASEELVQQCLPRTEYRTLCHNIARFFLKFKRKGLTDGYFSDRRFSRNPNYFRFIADLFSLISFTIIQSDSNKNQFWIDILNQGFTNYRVWFIRYDSSRMTLAESVDPWLEWTTWNWTNRNENFGGYLDEFHFRGIKYKINEIGISYSIPNPLALELIISNETCLSGFAILCTALCLNWVLIKYMGKKCLLIVWIFLLLPKELKRKRRKRVRMALIRSKVSWYSKL